MKYVVTIIALLTIGLVSAFAAEWHIEDVLDHSGIGSDCDVVIDDSGGLHVSFEYMGNNLGTSALKYAYKQNDAGFWVIQTISSGGGDYTGANNEIALDTAENPHISFTYEVDWEYIPMLRYAYDDGSSWQVEQLTYNTEYVEQKTTIGIDSNDYPHIIYNSWNDLHHRWEDASGWNDEVVASGSCESPHLVIDSSDDIHLIYSKDSSDEIKYAVKSGGTWTSETIETTTGFYDSSGFDMVLDASGYPHAVYRAGSRDVRYAHYNGTSWNVENINTDALGYPSIAIDSLGTVHTCYSVYTTESNRPLTYSYNDGGGWSTEEVDTPAQCWNTAMGIDQWDRLQIIYYNFSGGITKRAWYGDPVGVDEEDDIPITPSGYALYPAYPNPSSGNATISFALPETANVNLSVYDIKGRKVTTAASGEYVAGEHTADISGLASGIYLYKLTADEFSSTKKLIVK